MLTFLDRALDCEPRGLNRERPEPRGLRREFGRELPEPPEPRENDLNAALSSDPSPWLTLDARFIWLAALARSSRSCVRCLIRVGERKYALRGDGGAAG